MRADKAIQEQLIDDVDKRNEEVLVEAFVQSIDHFLHGKPVRQSGSADSVRWITSRAGLLAITCKISGAWMTFSLIVFLSQAIVAHTIV